MKQNQNSEMHLLRRVLVPLLIIAVPISAMIAFVLYYHRLHPAASPTSAPVSSVSFGLTDWPICRGNPALTGTASGCLPNNLKPLWRFQTGGAIKGSPIVAGNSVYVTSSDTCLYALNIVDGSLLWKFQADDELEAGPLYADNRVYIGSAKGTFYAIDAAAGTSLWQFSEAGKITAAANTAVDAAGRTLILLGSYDNTVYGLDRQTGSPVFKTQAGSYVNGSPAAHGGMVVFGSCDGFVHCVSLTDNPQEKTIDAGSYVASNPAILENTVYAGSYEGVFTAANLTDGQVLWRQSSKESDAFFSSPAVNEQSVVVGCRDNKLYCFDRRTGTLAWTFAAGDDFDSSPVICGSRVAVGNNDGRFYLVDLSTGKEVFSYTLGSPVVSSPAIAQNTLLIGCDNGLLMAFTAP